MFAVIKTGGKQYRVAANDLLKVEKACRKRRRYR
jgi:ribosomal protein L21